MNLPDMPAPWLPLRRLEAIQDAEATSIAWLMHPPALVDHAARRAAAHALTADAMRPVYEAQRLAWQPSLAEVRAELALLAGGAA